jgi:hypothetical protein
MFKKNNSRQFHILKNNHKNMKNKTLKAGRTFGANIHIKKIYI